MSGMASFLTIAKDCYVALVDVYLLPVSEQLEVVSFQSREFKKLVSRHRVRAL